MRRQTIELPGVVAFLLLLPGCAVLDQELGQALPLNDIDSVPIQGHYSEVLDRFGPPSKMSALAHGMVFQYEHIKLRERQYGLIFPGEIGKWIKAVYASADASVDTMTFIFDDGGLLRGSAATSWDADAGAGFSVTLVVSAGSMTDTQQYEDLTAGSLTWGRALTERPSKVLNSNQNLENGDNGIQLTATTEKVGQHTLELRK